MATNFDDLFADVPESKPQIDPQTADSFFSDVPELPPPTAGERIKGMGLSLLKGFPQAMSSVSSLVSLANPLNFLGVRGPAEASRDFFERGSEAVDYFQPESVKRSRERGFVKTDPATGEFEGLQAPSVEAISDPLLASLPQLPFFLAGGMGAGRAFQALKVPPRLAKALGFGTSNTALVAPTQYFETYEEAIAAGLPEEEARARARKSLLLNAPLTFATGTTGAGLAGSTGQSAKTLPRALAKGFVAEAPFEGIEEAGQSVIGDVAMERPVNLPQAVNTGLIGTAAGGLPGSAIAGIEQVSQRGQVEPAVDPEIVKQVLRSLDPQLAAEPAPAPEAAPIDLAQVVKEAMGATEATVEPQSAPALAQPTAEPAAPAEGPVEAPVEATAATPEPAAEPEPSAPAIDQVPVGETGVVYDLKGNPIEVQVTERSEAGSTRVRLPDGTEVIVDTAGADQGLDKAVYTESSADPNYKLISGPSRGHAVSTLPESELDAAETRAQEKLNAAVEARAAGNTIPDSLRDVNAIKAEKARRSRAGEQQQPTETQPADAPIESPVAPEQAAQPQAAPEPTTEPAAPAEGPVEAPVEAAAAPLATVEQRPDVALPTDEAPAFSDRYDRFIDKAFKRYQMEAQGQAILDDMVEAETSPRTVSQAFWAETYQKLNPKMQQRFRRMLNGLTGFEPGSLMAAGPEGDVVADSWEDIAQTLGEDLPDSAESLEGTERGYVSLMEWANQQLQAVPEQTRQPEAAQIEPPAGPVEAPVATERVAQPQAAPAPAQPTPEPAAPAEGPVSPPEAATEPAAEPEPLQPSAYMRGKNSQAVQMPDGSWRIRVKKAGRWHPWEKRESFDPSPTFGWEPHKPDSGKMRIAGEGDVQVSEPQPKDPPEIKGPPDLLVDLARGVGLDRAAFKAEGIDPADMTLRPDGFNYLFRKNGGMGPDQLLEWAQEREYLPPNPEGSPSTLTHNDALDMVSRALFGERFVSGANQQAEVEYQLKLNEDEQAAIDELEGAIDEPLPPGDEQASIDEYNQAYNEYVALRAQEGETDGDQQGNEGEDQARGDSESAQGPAQPIQPSAETQQGIEGVATPTGQETAAAAVKAADDQRNALGQDEVPVESGEGELFAGNEPGSRPEQLDIESEVSQNRLFTEDAATAARERLKSKLGTTRSGLDPEMLKDATIVAGFHVERGARSFAAFSKAMIKDFGDAIRPFLTDLYDRIRRRGEFEGMDPATETAPEPEPEASEAAAETPASEKTDQVFKTPEQATRAAESLTGKHIEESPEYANDDGTISEDVRVDSTLGSLAKGGLGFFESVTDKLRRSGSRVLVDLASRIDRYFDQREARVGWINGRIQPLLKKIPRRDRKAAMDEFHDYWMEHDNGRTKEAEALLEGAHPAVRELVEEVQSILSDIGDVNQKLGVKVYDGKIDGWRPIGKVSKGKFWPRTLAPDVQSVLQNPANDPALWEELVDALIRDGHIEERSEASRFIRNYFSREISNDYFAGIEKARGDKLPEEFYDYSWNAFQKYTWKWANRSSQIESFGQVTHAGTKDAFDRAIAETLDLHTKQYIGGARDAVYNRRPIDFFHSLIGNLNILATAIQLGNPATATLNFLGGTTLNVQMFGWRRVAQSYLKLLTDWGNVQKRGLEYGILGKDILMILRDQEQNMGSYFDAAGRAGDALSTFAGITMKWGGYKGTENIIRANAMIAAEIQLQDSLRAWNQNPGSTASLKYAAFMKRNGINVDKLLIENGSGPETAKYKRLMVNIPQGSYRIDQVPLYVDTPVGRFLFKYQKFGTQVSRMFWQNMLQPFVKSIVGTQTVALPGKRGSQQRVRTFMPLFRYFVAAFVGGSAILAARSALFVYNDPGPDWDDLEEALKDDERANTWALIFSRAWHSLMAASAAGFFGNYIQFGMDYADQHRAKNPLDPPGLASIDAVKELVQRWLEQGKLTANDLDQIGERTLAIFRGYKRMAVSGAEAMGSEWHAVRLQSAKRDLNYVRGASRRFADEMDIPAKRTIAGRIGRTPMSPINDQLNNLLLTGDGMAARKLVNETRREAEQKDRSKVLASMKSSARARRPIRVGNSTSEENRARFLRWAKKNVSEANYQRILEADRRYRNAERVAFQ